MADLHVVTITVAQAGILVQQRSDSARRNTRAVRTYAEAMREKNWALNGMPLIISEQGVLIDGYQRLLACLEAQTPFPTVLMHQGPVFTSILPTQPDPDVSATREAISAELARQYLARSMNKQRLSQTRITALAQDLAQGRELFDAQPICFAATGRLLKGRHRLRAILRTGGATDIAVVRGLDEAAACTYDLCAKKRSAASEAADSFGDQALVSATANLLWRHERKTLAMRNAKATASEIQEIISEHPRLLALRSFARRMGHYGRASVMGYGAYVMERENADLAAAFLAVLEDGPAQHSAHPIRTLCSTLQALRRRKAPQEMQLATLLAGWERFKARQTKQTSARSFSQLY